jgi:two-component system chemotaxis response regulator CheB
VIATSLGGIEALQTILSALPADFPVPILVVQHLQAHYKSQIAEILDYKTPLSVKWAEKREHLQPATVYIAPPDHHMVVIEPGIISLSQGPQEHFVRPSANPLFESAAAIYQNRTLAVVLTGMGSDGVEGVRAIKQNRGCVLVQNRATSRAWSMPSSALKTGGVDFVFSLRTIPYALITLVTVRGATQVFASPRTSRTLNVYPSYTPQLRHNYAS